MTTISEISKQEWEELNLSVLLSDRWFSFGKCFPEIETELRFIQYTDGIPPTEKVTMIISALQESTKSISVDRLIEYLSSLSKTPY